MKKWVCLLLSVLLIMGALFGCSRKEEAGPLGGKTKEPETQNAAYRIGLVQCGSYAPLDVMREAFLSRLDEWGYDETKVELDYQNAGEDEKKASEICKQFTRDKVDLIVAVGAPAAKAASDAVGSSGIKVLFAGVNDPTPTLGVQNLAVPERGITGVSDRVAGKKSVEFAQHIQPELRTIGLLYDAEDVNACSAAKAIQDYCRQAGVQTVASTVVTASGVEAALQELCNQADVIFTPGDSVVLSAAGKIAEITGAAKKPWLAGTDVLVQNGALAGLSSDYEVVGNKTADMAVKVIVGTQVSQLSVYFFDNWVTWINQTALSNFEGELSEEFLSTANYVP